MIATRFKYDYTFMDALLALYSLFRKEESVEGLFKDYFPDSRVYMAGSARIGIKQLLKSFQLKNGAKVGVQPYTCSSVFSAIANAGYMPVFIDVNEQLSLDVNDLQAKIGSIDALIVTHIFGFPADIPKIKQIASNIPVIEDCAHAFFSEYEGKLLGTFFDAAVFSFGNGKFPSLGSGGLFIINNDKHTRIQPVSLPKPGLIMELNNIMSSFISAQVHSKIGYAITMFFNRSSLENKRIDCEDYPEQEYKNYKSLSYLLKYKLPIYKERSKDQNSNGKYLSSMLLNKYRIIKMPASFVNYFAFPLFAGNRDLIFDYLWSKGVICGKHFQYSLLWAEQFGYQKGACANFEKLVVQILTIPSNYSLHKKDIDKIIYYLNEAGD